MKAKLIIIASLFSVSNVMAGIPTDSSGNKMTTDLGCMYYGTFSKSECGYTTKTVKPVPVVKAKPVVIVKPTPIILPTPAPAPAPVVARIIKLDGVSFKSNSDILNASSYSRLDTAAAELLDNPEVRVLVAGHSDSLGNNDYNQSLSEKRAKAVKAYLENKGVSSKRIESRGYGEDQPIASNATRSGRSENRRVELRVID